MKAERGIRKETTDEIVCLAKIDSSDISFKGPRPPPPTRMYDVKRSNLSSSVKAKRSKDGDLDSRPLSKLYSEV